MKNVVIDGIKTQVANPINNVFNYNVDGMNNATYNKLYLSLCNLYKNVSHAHAGCSWFKDEYFGYIACSN